MGITMMSRRWVGVAVICFVFATGSTAKADNVFMEPYVEDLVAIMIVFGITEGIVVGTGLLTSFVSAHYGSKEKQPPMGWLIGGYAAGGANVALGIFLIAINEGNTQGVALGITQIVFGGLDIGLTVWAHSQPEEKEQKLTLTPMIMPDARGRPALGVGLRLVDW